MKPKSLTEHTKEAEAADESLHEFTADLVAAADGTFLMRLFSCPPGHWVYVDELSEGDEALLTRLDSIEDEHEIDLLVSWQNYGHVPGYSGFASIVFYAEGLGWSTVAVFNKSWLDSKRTADVGL